MSSEKIVAIVQLMNTLPKFVEQYKDFVQSLQQGIWSLKSEDGAASDLAVLRELAYDLDYYEADVRSRSQDPSFYGEDKVCQVIRSALANLSNSSKSPIE